MIMFKPTGKVNLLYQLDGTHDIFKALADAQAPLQSGFLHSSITRYMMTANVVQYQCAKDNPSVLDLGCGAASFAEFWEKNYSINHRKQITYLGLEANVEYVKEAQSLGHTVLRYDANNDDIGDIAFSVPMLRSPDIVLMQQFVEHIDPSSLENLLAYFKLVLPQDGFMVISAPNPKYGSKILEHHHDKEYTFEEMEELLAKFKFKIKHRLGWLGFGEPKYSALSDDERCTYHRLLLVSKGYADAVMCAVNPIFAPYYYLVITK